MLPRPGERVLDVGGSAHTWKDITIPLSITIVNVPGGLQTGHLPQHKVEYIEGDGCDLNCFSDQSFDIVHSNSVIEHVGPESRQQAFAREVRRIGKRYWVQTPAKWFPIEAHCGMPFWWFYPEPLRAFFISRWRPGLPLWTDMVAETRVLELAWLRELFPDATVHTEWMACFPKSFVMYRP